MKVTKLSDGRYKIKADPGKVLVNNEMIALDLEPIIYECTSKDFKSDPREYAHEVSIEDFYKFREEVAKAKCKSSRWTKIAEVLSIFENPGTVIHFTLTATNVLIFLLWILLRLKV